MSFTLHPRALAVLACFIPLAVAAQPTTSPELEPIVVTPSRIAQLKSEVVGDVSVIDQDTLARAVQSSVAELLSRVPGIQISNNGGPQTQTSIFIRGNESKHTLVLIDGIRINSSVSSLYNL
ncbi:MAG TPA: TonB-dependent receptor plug domain-containing protein, partial [Candidatus Paenalcaligenes intestinipullorum]|nr:TonB-dependent receptor plug domain-containing protein [Candidatus Paenalcaligenes intestinipullorum]